MTPPPIAAALPGELATWTSAKRSAFAACWALVTAGPAAIAPTTTEEGAAVDALLRAAAASVHRLAGALPGAVPLLAAPMVPDVLAALAGELVPPMRAEEGGGAADRAAWEAVAEVIAPAALADVVNRAPALAANDTAGPRLAPERLPPLAAAVRWLANLRAKARRPAVAKRLRHAYAGRRAGGLVPVSVTVERSLRECRGSGAIPAELDHRELAALMARRGMVPAPGFGLWRVLPPSGTALHLPFDAPPRTEDGGKLPGVALRQVLNGGVLRAFLVACALWADQGAGEAGLFARADAPIFRDLLGKRGGGGERQRKLFSEAFERLTEIMILETTSLRIVGGAPASLITEVRETAERARTKPGAGRARIYFLAPLLVMEVRRARNFLQVPQGVLRLDPSAELPLGLALASFWRANVGPALRGAGFVRRPLAALLAELGDSPDEHARDRGAGRHYASRAAMLVRVAAAAGLGAVHVEGEGPAAVVTLELSAALAAAYGGLLDAPPPPRLLAPGSPSPRPRRRR